MATLHEQKWAIAREYARQFAELMDATDWHFIGTDDREKGQPDILDLDTDVYSMSDVMMVIDRLPEWVERYGSREAVASEIRDWLWWWLDKDTEAEPHPLFELYEDRHDRSLRTSPSINLEHWLMGCPREPRPRTPHDRLRELRTKHEMLIELAEEFRETRTLGNVIDNIFSQMKPLQAECDRLDEESVERFRREHPGIVKAFEDAVREENGENSLKFESKPFGE